MKYHVKAVAVSGNPKDLENELNKISGEIISVSYVGYNAMTERIYTVVYSEN